MWMWAWGATGSAEISVEVGALPARLEGGVTAGGQVGGALESRVGMGGALGGTCWCGQGFGGQVLVWVWLWSKTVSVCGMMLRQEQEAHVFFVRVCVKQNSFCNPTLAQKLT